MRTLLIALLANIAALAAGHAPAAVPLFFIPNIGQAPEPARFVASGSGLTAAFSPDRVAFRVGQTAIEMVFEDADPQCRVEGREPLAGRVNLLQGSEDQWRSGIRTYGSVVYRELYPGIDMAYGGHGRNLKSEFIVAPEADISAIQIRYSGASAVRVADDGALVIAVDGMEMREEKPVAYQKDGAKRIPVSVRYALAPDGGVGFIVNSYNSALPLVIDPVISYSTLLGGSSSDAAISIAVDSSGAVYLAGFTASQDFPTTNPVQNLSGGGNDVFVAKLNAAGTALVYCTYLGGTGDDRANGIAVDPTGAAYVTGSTMSKNFPVRNALQSKLAGNRNAFLVKLNPAGNAMVFGTYLGGSGSDTAYGVAIDAAGNAYLTGDTSSVTFPATGYQKSNHGSQDAFVTKVSADGSRLVYSTFLGGSGTDHGAAIVVGASGSAVVTGSTFSTDFPVSNAYQPSNAGGQDVFLTKLSADGSSLLFSTYWGGSGGGAGYAEIGQGIALDGQENIYVTGMTSSSNFPVIQPQQSSLNGWVDAFISKFTPVGWPVYSTYFGGSGVDAGNAIAVDSSGNAYVAGYTYSTDLPVVNPQQPSVTLPGDVDAMLGILNASGSAFTYLSYLGGAGNDTATSIALDPLGSIYMAGWTMSTNFPLIHPLQSTNGGNYGAFVLKMQQLALQITCTHTGSFTQNQNGTYTVTVQNISAAATSGIVLVTDTVSSGLTLLSMSGTGWNCSAASCNRSDVLTAGASYPPITVTVKTGLTATSPQQNTATVRGGGDSSVHSVTDATNILTTVTYSVSGHVTVEGAGVGGVTVSLSGSLTASATTDASGAYTFPNLPAGGSYTVTPSAANYLFTPITQSVANLPANQTLDFTAVANLAKGMTATQNSTYGTSVAGLAADGNTSGVFSAGSVSIANSAPNAWWQVDLGSSVIVNSISIWGRTDCCGSLLNDYWIFVSDTPFGASDTPATLQVRANTWSSHQTTAPNPSSVIAASGTQGRYVRVQLSGTNYLELAEVQVFGTVYVPPPPASDLAQGKTATQSSTYSASTAAALSVDGNTDGAFSHGSLSVTNSAANSWWQVDLGAAAIVNSITVWGRTDCCGTWLNDYWVFVSNTPFNATDTPATLQNRAGTWSSHQTTYPNPSAIIAVPGAQGRYVRVQLSGTNFLEMAEVQVAGSWTTGTSTYAISGRVVSGAAGVAGMTMSLSGSSTATATTDSSGNYSFAGLTAGSNYTVTPSGAGYTFTPASQAANNLSADQTLNFSAATVAPSNLAQGKAATQSTTYSTCAASLAVDRNTDGNYSHGSLSLTNGDANGWWQVDLGAPANVSSIVIWGRTDCCSTWLNDYWVFVSDTPFNSTDTPATLQTRANTWSSHQTQAPSPTSTITIPGAQGRYVRVQLSGTNYLEMAEVQVLGTWK